MNVTRARRRDAYTWWTLWDQFLHEHDQYSQDTLGPEAKSYWEDYFYAYVNGSRPGVVLLGYENGLPIGTVMTGAMLVPSTVPSKLGNVGHVHGVWIAPEYRGVDRIMAFGEPMFEACREAGLTALVTMVHVANKSPLGALLAEACTPYATLYCKSL